MRLSRDLVCLSVLCLAVALFCQTSTAGVKMETRQSGSGMHVLGMGGAAIGMGGAFTAIADDANAPFWNPAGLSKIQKFMFQPPNYQLAIDDDTTKQPIINVTGKDGDGAPTSKSPAPRVTDELGWDALFGKIPSQTNDLEGILKHMGWGTIGLDVSSNIAIAGPRFAVFMQPMYQVGLDTRYVIYRGGEPWFGRAYADGIEQINIGISVARPIKQGGDIGVTVRSVRSTQFFEIFDVDSGSMTSAFRTDDEKTGVALDLGYMRDVSPNATFGLMIRNLLEPQVDGNLANRQVNVGYARTMPGGKWLLAADLQQVFDHPIVHLGARYNAGKGFYLCGGLFGYKPTVGIGANLFGAKLQFAYSPERNSILAGSLYW